MNSLFALTVHDSFRVPFDDSFHNVEDFIDERSSEFHIRVYEPVPMISYGCTSYGPATSHVIVAAFDACDTKKTMITPLFIDYEITRLFMGIERSSFSVVRISAPVIDYRRFSYRIIHPKYKAELFEQETTTQTELACKATDIICDRLQRLQAIVKGRLHLPASVL